MWICQILYFGRRRSPVFLCGVCGVQCDPFENFPSPFWTKMRQNEVCRKEWKRNTVKKKEARRKLPSSVSLSPYDVVTQLAVQPLFRLSTRCFHDQNEKTRVDWWKQRSQYDPCERRGFLSGMFSFPFHVLTNFLNPVKFSWSSVSIEVFTEKKLIKPFLWADVIHVWFLQSEVPISRVGNRLSGVSAFHHYLSSVWISAGFWMDFFHWKHL